MPLRTNQRRASLRPFQLKSSLLFHQPNIANKKTIFYPTCPSKENESRTMTEFSYNLSERRAPYNLYTHFFAAVCIMYVYKTNFVGTVYGSVLVVVRDDKLKKK